MAQALTLKVKLPNPHVNSAIALWTLNSCDLSLSVQRAAIAIIIRLFLAYVGSILCVAVPAHAFPVIDVGR